MVCAPSKDSDQPGHPPSLIRVFTVRLKIDRILSYSWSARSAQRRLWSDWASAADWSESSLGSHANSLVLSRRGSNKGRVIVGNDAVENFYVCFFMSAWVQVLDFTKSLVYSDCQNDRKCLFLFLIFFFFFFFCVCVFRLCMRFITYNLMLCINYL